MIELINKRKLNEKRFLKDNGNIEIQLYRNNVHYLRNGKYIEISNELKECKDTLENIENDYRIVFNKKTGGIKYSKESNYIEFIPKNYKDVECILEENTKEVSKVLYKNIIDNIDLEYVLSFEGVKENVIIKKYSKIDKIQFDVKSNLILKNEDKVLKAKKGKEVIFNFNVPYMKDNNGEESNEVIYSIKNKENEQLLTILFSNKWLKSKDRKYPIIIDPTYENNTNVEDTYIYPGDTNDTRYNKSYINVGVEKINNQDIVNRGLIKFSLPELGPSDEIVNAELFFYGYMATEETRVLTEEEIQQNTQKLLNIHQVTNDWSLETANWNNMNDKYKLEVENVAYIARSYLEYDVSVIPVVLKPVIESNLNSCLITRLVKKWYSGTPNYGIMVKQPNEIYINKMTPKLFSSNYSTGNLAPLLKIEYRNQNGLESYWDYMTQNYVNGNSFINTFNGNLVTLFHVSHTIGIYLANVGIVYNTNDVIQNNDTIYGKGYRLTYDQTIEELNSSFNNVLIYTDGDGTIHVFQKDDSQNNVYYDVDGLNYKVEKDNLNYVLTDKNGNKMFFEFLHTKYCLKKIVNVKKHNITITRNSNNRISKIIDENNNEINISYEQNSISFVSPAETTILNYDNGILKSIVTKEGTTTFTYNSSNLITKIIDVNGLFTEFEYNFKNTKKISKVTQFGLNNSEGSSLHFEYNFFNTNITDNDGKTINKIYGYYGNLLSSNNLANGITLKDAYSITKSYGNKNENLNKILSESSMIKFSKNCFGLTKYTNVYCNSIFSNDMVLSDYNDVNYEGVSLVEFSSNKIKQYSLTTFSLPSTQKYTVSFYVKSSIASKIKFYISDSEFIYEKNMTPSDDYEKIVFSFEKNSSSNLIMKIEHDEIGVTYIGDINIEYGEIANDFNIMTNADFENGIQGWSLNVSEVDNNSNLDPDNYFEVVNIDNLGNKALKVNMESLNMTNISQTILISGNANDLYYLGFWYKNNGLETGIDPTKSYDSSASIVGNTVSVVALPQSGGIDFCVPATPLTACKDIWQYCHVLFKPTQNYSSIRIDLHQGRDNGSLYLTNFTLIKKIKSNIYTYDENGNVLKADNSNGLNIFNYDKNNELISATSHIGKYFKYEYDNIITNRVIRTISSSGISNKVNYDTYGNPIRVKISKDYSKIIDTGYYKIRQKGTYNYLKIENNTLTLKYDYCNNTTFKVIANNNIYNISDAINEDKYVTEVSNMVVLHSMGNKDLKFEKCSDSSYNIYCEDNNQNKKYLKWVGDHFEFVDDYSDIVENNLYEYYLENTKQLFIENEAEYGPDGRFMIKQKDSLLHETIYQYNNLNGLLTKITNSNGTEINYYYNDKDRLIRISKGNRDIEYNYNNTLLSEIKQGNKVFSFHYDNFLNADNIKVNNKILISNTYDENNGNILSTVYGNNALISYQYDIYNRLKRVTKENEIYDYKYNNNGKVSKIVENNSETCYIYDTNQRLREMHSIRYGNNFYIKMFYDVDNNIRKQLMGLNNVNHTIVNLFNDEGQVLESTIDDSNIKYLYDDLLRLVMKKINNSYEIKYDYETVGKRTSQLLKAITNGNNKFSCNYDESYNITEEYLNNNLLHHYEYNDYNELILDIDYMNAFKYEFVYDNNGNILSKTKKDLNTDNILNTDLFEYNDNSWKDLLTKYNNTSITYDSIGNPLTIGDNALLWVNGKQLSSFNSQSLAIEYRYDLNGKRTKKTINNVAIEYCYSGSKLIFERRTNDIIYYLYDLGGIIGLNYNGVVYYYLKNVQGIIIGIVDSNNSLIVKYEYDSYGNILSIKNSSGEIITDSTNIGIINPIRYKSYYYDNETDLYYLNARYYNPKWGRFLNMDNIIDTNQDKLLYNAFCYCINNPIVNRDSSGNVVMLWFKNLIKNVAYFYNYVIENVKKTSDKDLSQEKYNVKINVMKKTYNVAIDNHTIRYDSSSKANGFAAPCDAYAIAEASYKAYRQIYGEEMKGRTINGLYSELMYHQLAARYLFFVKDVYDTGIVADMGDIDADKNAEDFENGTIFPKLALPTTCEPVYKEDYSKYLDNDDIEAYFY